MGLPARAAAAGAEVSPAGCDRAVCARLQLRLNKSRLRDFDLAELPQALLALFLLFQKLAFARDVAAIEFGDHVLARGQEGPSLVTVTLRGFGQRVLGQLGAGVQKLDSDDTAFGVVVEHDIG